MKTLEFIREKGIHALTTELGIAVKEFYTPEGDLLYLLDYNQIDSPKTDLVVMECRSLIIDAEYNVVSRSFDRFFNYGEALNVMPEIDWSKAVVFPKIDGSLIKIYNYKGRWYVSTRGMAFADSQVGNWGLTFKELVMKALNVTTEKDFQEKCAAYLLEGCTYIFEITSMENRVVTRYEGYQLHHLATRRYDGKYHNVNERGEIHSAFGSNKIQEYSFNTVEDCIKATKELPNLEEGYVVYQDGVPVCKIKSPAYVAVHHIRGEGLNPKRIMQLVLVNEVEEYLTYFPEDAKYFIPYQIAYKNMGQDIYQKWLNVFEIEEQKEFALMVKDEPYSSVLFTARKNKISLEEAFNQQSELYKLRLLESYVKV